MGLFMHALLDNYACISATEAQELGKEESWISMDTILTCWLPVSIRETTFIAYIECRLQLKEDGAVACYFKITLCDAVKKTVKQV